MNKKSIWTILIIVVVAALGFAGYRQIAAKKVAAEAPATETAVVERGELSVTVEAAGSLTPPTEITLSFPVAGKLYEISVIEGQAVKQGDLLARLEDNIQAEADFQALFTDAGVAKAELAVANAEEALDDALGDLKYRIGTVTYYWEGQLKQAEEALAALNADPNAGAEPKAEAQKAVDKARAKVAYFLEENLDYLEKEDDW
ncbi:MAG: biotin/lipoyl-binding protein, partial [Chloroflexota bacterium]